MDMVKTRTIQGTNFIEGQLVQACGVDFTLHQIGKRCLILRPGFHPPAPNTGPADDEPENNQPMKGNSYGKTKAE